ncbi:ATP-dependent sacrificial sulfur transferase LarE [Prochlorothrix hollandica]|uniref:ATP-dependent sacrificial sulfur transferase LarE n=1 Tax=Prochlorothrix hollandica TaxID=1223 RepID=UPI0033424F95
MVPATLSVPVAAAALDITDSGLNPVLAAKYQQLQAFFAPLDRVLIAYSGGIDSTLVAKIAVDVLGDLALAVTAVSPSLLPEDLEDARHQAAALGIAHEEVSTQELDNPNYSSNPVNRCYFCKSELHDTLKPLALDRGYPYVVDGVNGDDLQDYRPGIQAAQERGARSPLAEVGLSKLEVRQLSQYLGLPWWDKPAQPCLSSRFPYGEAITPEKLQRVGRGERYLRTLGWRNLRVRSVGDTARIELPPDQIQSFVAAIDLPNLVAAFQDYGFLFVTLDLEGFQSGKLNRVLGLSPTVNSSPVG